MKSMGHVAYDAYRNHTGGVSLISGQPIPEWRDLKPEIKSAWEAAADAVLGRGPRADDGNTDHIEIKCEP